ncbi:hypothetical protein MKW98_016858 [Papaver atlanticum]|uniref:CRIB domain-containing protein n=1 Tax=Papaver atlanticum TaxID=357466 RepID=A0AAD4TGQ6_9MAGN|nr:hypothetical protein MKW98_016858 [Papaver atlanticum]
MKGILKGLRYISQIFENEYEEEEEEEMQIGCPTDVQHVAHIGVEGPAVANPSWMNGKKSEASESASKAKNKKGEANTTKSKAKNASQDLSQEGTDLPQSTQDMPEVAKPSRNRRHSNSVTLNSAETQQLEVPKKSSRRGHSLDLTETKKSSTTKKSQDHSSSSNEGLDAPSIPKSSRKKKLKESPSTVGVPTSNDRRKGSKESNSLSTSNVQVPGPVSEPANKNHSSELSQEDLDDDLKLEEKGF